MVKPQMDDAPAVPLRKQQGTHKPAKHNYKGLDFQIPTQLASSIHLRYFYQTIDLLLLKLSAQTICLGAPGIPQQKKKKIHYCLSRQGYPLD